MLHRLLLLLLVCPLFLATSCIELQGEEEIWINLDASGHVTTRYEIPRTVMTQLGKPSEIISALKIIDEKEDDFKITKCTCEKEGKNYIFILEAEFDDILELLKVAERHSDLFAEESATDTDKISAIAGDVDFRFEGLRPAFNRDINFADIIPPIVASKPKWVGESTFKYIIHLPARVKDTNAHTISDDRKTVSWTFLLKDHLKSPMAMSLTTELPIPWWGWILLALILLALVWLIWRFAIRRFLRSPSPTLD